jgi:phosphatidylglycerol:prolipoprotein diacylglycerol transferase
MYSCRRTNLLISWPQLPIELSGVWNQMHPVFFHIGNFEVSSFGIMVALGALVGLWLFKRELAARSVPASALDAAIAGLLGGMIGAKLLFVAEHAGQEPFLSLLLDRGGLSWFGGFAGGIGLGALTLMLRKLSILRALAAVTPALAIGQMFGRFGCFLVGDDYGRPTSLPWGVAFPEGLPPTEARVHPTQLYEAAFLGLLTLLLLRWSRRGASDRLLVARYLLLAGATRFLIEFIRVNTRVALGLTVAQFASLGLVGAGLVIWLAPSRAATAAKGKSVHAAPGFGKPNDGPKLT